MTEEKQVNILDKQIEKAAKKLNIFNIDDLANIVEAKKKDIVASLDKLIEKGIIKKHSDGFIVIPKDEIGVYYSPNFTPEKVENNSDNKSEKEKELGFLIEHLTLKTADPKEIYIKYFTDIEGYYKFFFAPEEVRRKIIFILKSLKTTQSYSNDLINDYCYENGIILDGYKKAAELLPTRGFSLFLPEYQLEEPLELYEYFKEFYLAPYGLSAKDALDLAHKKLEDYINADVDWEGFKGVFYYLRKVVNDYSVENIRNLRKYNYSEFDFESMKPENLKKPR